METRAGTSVLLSLCIVAVAAVALYRPDPSRTTPPVIAPDDLIPPESVAAAEVESALPEPTAGVPLPPPEPTIAHAVAVPSPKQASRPATLVKKVSNTRHHAPSSFTTVGVGETLPDIAIRVYGSPDATDTLFRANRDVLNAPDDPLQVGGMLRTP